MVLWGWWRVVQKNMHNIINLKPPGPEYLNFWNKMYVKCFGLLQALKSKLLQGALLDVFPPPMVIVNYYYVAAHTLFAKVADAMA